MISPDETERIEAVIPGVAVAYEALLSTHGRGIHTSTGSFYNHTIFGRDASMTAKFVCSFDSAIARDVIRTLASLQGVAVNRRTQEEPGRIHHEWRDFRLWHGTWQERLLLLPWKYLWGGNSKLLLTYFAADPTASYIRLINKYSVHIDAAVLAEGVTDKSGREMTVAESVARAADWLVRHVDDGALITTRTNVWSLPFQTYRDSITAYSRRDRSLAKYRGPMGYVEDQAFAADALYDAARLLPDHASAAVWREAAHRLRDGLFEAYLWNSHNDYPSSALDRRGALDRHTITPGWALNTSLWDEMPEGERAARIRLVVEELFSERFMTPVGLRTRAVNEPAPLGSVAEYHGRLTVWPMFNFMVIEGLRRHRLYDLADELTNRTLNGLNGTGTFDEFLLVNPDGQWLAPAVHGGRSLKVQMFPEQNIAFSVVPALVMARRLALGDERAPQAEWQHRLETDVLARIDRVPLLTPDEARAAYAQAQPVRLRRVVGGLVSAMYFVKESLRP